MIEGSICALLTPFKDGAVDEAAFARFVEWQLAQGTQGVVPCGTTGESPTLTHDEHKRVTELCIEVVNGRVPVIAGTGSNSTHEAVELTQHAREAGADAALVVTPYYNKPTQAGLYQHFHALAEDGGLPIIIYNIPGRSVVDMSVETMAELARHPRIIGVKDATGDLARVAGQRQMLGEDFIQLSGEDATAVGFNAMGGRGCISVTANIAPALCARMQKATLSGDFKTALDLQDTLLPLHQALFAETSPMPAKAAAAMLGLFSEELRLPLVPISDATRTRLQAVVDALELLVPAE